MAFAAIILCRYVYVGTCRTCLAVRNAGAMTGRTVVAVYAEMVIANT